MSEHDQGGTSGYGGGFGSAGGDGGAGGSGVPPGPGPGPAPATPAAAPPGWYTLPDGQTAWWDGVQWQFQPAGQVATEPFKAVDGLAKATVGMIAFSGLVSLVSAGAELNRVGLMSQIIDDPLSVSASEANSADDVATLVGVVDIIVLLAAGIIFLIWLNRVFKNLQGPLRSGRLEYTPGWAVGWWFVPFANFVKPKQVMNEAWKASDPGSSDPRIPPTHWNNRKPPALLSWWWAAWISAGLVSRLAVSWGGDPELQSPESLQTGFLWSAVGSGLYVVAAVLAILVVRSVAERHEQRARNLAARGGWGA